MKLSVVIRAYNEEQHIGRLLTGLSKQLLAPAEVILVDSGSTDRTVEIARSHGARVVSIQPEQFTFGRSLNLGLEHAGGDLAVLASAHVYPVYPDWLQHLTEPFTDPAVGLVYGKQRGDRTTRFSERQVFAQWYPEQSVAGQSHAFCNNANAAIRLQLWSQHRYSETLPGLEDIEWATWLMSQGQSIVYSAEAEVRHVHNESYRQIYNRYRREAMGLRQIHPEQRFSLPDFVRFTVSNSLSDLKQARGEGVIAGELGGILRFRLAQFWGTYRGSQMAGPLSSELRRAFYYPRRSVAASAQQDRSRLPAIEYGDSGEPSER